MKQLCLIFLVMTLPCFARYSCEYDKFYSHLHLNPCHTPHFTRADFFLVILLDARHLDYTDNRNFFRTLVKHPSDGSKNCDVGHAWIYLQGVQNGVPVCLEGGHSGELGERQPRYFEGVLHGIENEDPNPIKYLWATQYDGFFQEGAGGHAPNFAVKVNITPQQFEEILAFIENYHFELYSITQNQCSSFVAQIAEIAGLKLNCRLSISIASQLFLCGEWITLWKDPKYSCITISTPDILERSLTQALQEGKCEYALPWYLKTHKDSFKHKAQKTWQNMVCFPSRAMRFLEFAN